MSLLSGNLELAAGAVPFPCGQCLPCRINKRRIWTHRLMLELFAHDAACFVTLTYDDDHISSNHSLDKRDAQLFLKRLRKRIEPLKIRYYLVGEYGETTYRPHYHAIIFGISYEDSKVIADSWDKGHVMVGTCTHDSIQYVAGYVVKKFVKKDNNYGLVPEFSLMSRKPGIGFFALDDIVKLMKNPHFRNYISLKGDVPDGLLHGKKFLPFGRYLKNKLRDLMNIECSSDVFFKEMREKYFEFLRDSSTDSLCFADSLVSESNVRAERQKARYKIFNRRNKI